MSDDQKLLVVRYLMGEIFKFIAVTNGWDVDELYQVIDGARQVRAWFIKQAIGCGIFLLVFIALLVYSLLCR
jgi:hypothetical protein